jgi:hypothetical protein
MSFSWLASRRPREVLWLAGLVALALAVRLKGLAFGLPLLSNYYIRPDETLVVIPAIELVARHGDPGHVNYPAAMMGLLTVVYHALHAVLAPLGAAAPSFGDDAGGNLSRYFLAGRVVSALAGTLAAGVVYRIAVRFAAPLAAAFAALWYAVSPLAVREAHFAVTDTLLALLVSLAVLAAIRAIEAPPASKRCGLLACGVVVGAAVATKYTAVVLVPAIGLALLPAVGRGRRVRMAVEWGLAAGATFAVLNPWLIAHPGPLLAWIARIVHAIYVPRESLADAARATQGWPGLLDYAGLLPGGRIGAACAVAGAVLGLARWWRRGDARILPPVVATLAFVVLFAPASTLPFRYLAPLLPLAAVSAALALDVVSRRVPARLGVAVVVAIGVAGIAATAPATWHLVRSLAMEDTRSEAGRWIDAHVSPSVPVVWLGSPESEPQLREAPASIRRRIAYVEGTYGPTAARVIERVYLLSMRVRATDGRQVFRNPRPADLDARLVCVVQAAYPSPTVTTDRAALDAWTRGRIVARAQVGAPLPPGRHLLEPWDAFYLPLDLARPMQPGPRFDLFLVERE